MNAAVITALGVVLAAVISARLANRRQLNEIHVLVNSRLTKALTEIQALKKELGRDGK